jgi:hypothetical protein
MPDNHDMADLHEKDIADALGGTRTRASGAVWFDKGDGRAGDHLDTEFAWAWDCKATAGKSIAVSRAMLAKLVTEAHGERPLLPLRFYNDDRGGHDPDWVVVLLDDFLELLERLAHATSAAAELKGKLAAAGREKRGLEHEVERLQGLLEEATPEPEPARKGPGDIPQLPWTVVYQQKLPTGGVTCAGIYWDEQGHMHPKEVGTVRVEPTSSTESRLIVDDQIVRAGDLYAGSRRIVRVGA